MTTTEVEVPVCADICKTRDCNWNASMALPEPSVRKSACYLSSGNCAMWSLSTLVSEGPALTVTRSGGGNYKQGLACVGN